MAKLDAGDYAAIILACAGLERLGWGERITRALPIEQWLPSPGQAIIGIECCQDSPANRYLAELDDPEARCSALAERALAAKLEAGCHWPLAAFAIVQSGAVNMRAALSLPDGSHQIEVSASATCEQAEALGLQLADQLLAAGGREIIAALDQALV